MLPTKFQFIWESGFRGEDFFRNQPIRNKNGLWQPCLLTDRDEMFQRRRLKCEKLTNDRRRMPSYGKSSPCQREGELKKSIKTI